MFKIKLTAKRFSFFMINLLILKPLAALVLVLLYPTYLAANHILKKIDNGDKYYIKNFTDEEIERTRRFTSKYHNLYGVMLLGK